METEIEHWGDHRQRIDECLIQFRFEMVTLTMEAFTNEHNKEDLLTTIQYRMKEDLREFYTHLGN